MNEWIPIRYLGFWDVPRNFFVRWGDQLLLFDCPFDDELDDYPDDYAVYQMPELMLKDIESNWIGLPDKAIRVVGHVPITDVKFDGTRRRAIRSEIFSRLEFKPMATTPNGQPHDAIAAVIPH